MTIVKSNILLLYILLILSPVHSVQWLNEQENLWLAQNQNKTMMLGFDPNAGMDYFQLNNREYGFVLILSELINNALGINLIPETEKTWGEAFNGLQNGDIDILFGANETEERKKIMLFTEPLYQLPYSLMAAKNSEVFVVGDLENSEVGFIEGDIIIDIFPDYYKSIKYSEKIFNNQEEALTSLNKREIDAFITSGGHVIHEYLKKFPDLKEVKILKNFTSDMTLSVRQGNDILSGILNKFIAEYSTQLKEQVSEITYLYNYKIMELSNEDIEWILNDGEAIVGVADGYLPFEYYENNNFLGINASILREISKLSNIRFTPVKNDFNTLFQQAVKGEIHIMNIAKTSERIADFYYTQAFSRERDLIYGQKQSPTVQDIYGLKNTTIAVVNGYWHEELLQKNSIEADILRTENLKESMNAILNGKADYMIENPSVMKYFIQEWEMYELIEKGLTSYNSYLYFGVSQNKPELVRIMDRAMDLIDLEGAIHRGYNEIPHSSNKRQILFQLILIGCLSIVLILLGIFTYRQANALIHSKKTTERLKEREELMYRDPMTLVYNRHYLYHKVEPFIKKWKYPQTVIICDLNNLKLTNDKWGHSIGDKLLSTFGSVLKKSFDVGDILIRMGGDEFMIIITGRTKEEAEVSTARMEKELEEIHIPISADEYIIPSTAWGMATRYHSSEIDFENLQIEADDRMYDHKKNMKDIL